MGMCVCTHHHFIIDLPHSRVFHSHRHVSGLVWLSSCSVRRPSNGRYSCTLAMIITIITIIRRRDAAQPKNHHRQPSSSPVALAPPLRFLHLLLLLLFLLPHTASFLSPLLVGASSAVPLVRQKSSLCRTARRVFSLTGDTDRRTEQREKNQHTVSALALRTYVCTYASTHTCTHPITKTRIRALSIGPMETTE